MSPAKIGAFLLLCHYGEQDGCKLIQEELCLEGRDGLSSWLSLGRQSKHGFIHELNYQLLRKFSGRNFDSFIPKHLRMV